MSEGIWLPGLIVLAVGLGAGLVAAWRLRRGTTAEPKGDVDLRIRDLEARRDDLYRRLRRDDLTPDDRASLELAAARVLRDLDHTRAEAGLAPVDAARPAVAEPEAAAAAPARPVHRWSGVVGFAAGLAVASLVGLLVYWAGRDAAPGERTAPMPRQSSAAGVVGGELPPDHPPIDGGPTEDEAQQLASLEERLASDPSDLMARKELSLVQLSAGMYMEAFESAQGVLEAVPEDPDGLFVQGVVRLTMGQNQEAIDLFDRVLARYPNHLQAMAYRGLGLYQLGQLERAVDTWEMGLEMAGGQSPQIEALLQMASQRELPADHPPIAADGGGQAPAPAPAAPPEAMPERGGGGAVYRARLELPPGVGPPPGAVLFVALRPAAGGPPTAVKRIDRATFPMEVEISQQDSMMGGELPEAGLLTARLDTDGSATTRSAGDLAAEAQVAIGDSVSLMLAPDVSP